MAKKKSKKKKKPSKKMVPQYYTESKNSVRFWNAVHTLKGKEFDAAYMMGCMLQDLESRVLYFLDEKRKAESTECPHCKGTGEKDSTLTIATSRNGKKKK